MIYEFNEIKLDLIIACVGDEAKGIKPKTIVIPDVIVENGHHRKSIRNAAASLFMMRGLCQSKDGGSSDSGYSVYFSDEDPTNHTYKIY